MNAAEAHIRVKVQMVVADERSFGVLSSAERIAVALVLDRYDLLEQTWGTMLEAVNRLGQECTEAALRVQRQGAARPASGLARTLTTAHGSLYLPHDFQTG